MTDITQQILEQDNARLQDEIAQMRRLLERPIQIQSQENDTLKQVTQYLPQLTHIATNLSYTSSALQALKPDLADSRKSQARIADALERIATALEGGESE